MERDGRKKQESQKGGHLALWRSRGGGARYQGPSPKKRKRKRRLRFEIVVFRSCDRDCSCKLASGPGDAQAPSGLAVLPFIVPLLQLATPKRKPSRINR